MTTPPTVQLIEPLTDAEQRVLELMADGLTDKEIAAELNIAPITVRSDHKQNIYDKFGLQKPHRSKKWAVYCAHELGMLMSVDIQAGIAPNTAQSVSGLRPQHNLPSHTTAFIGRKRNVTELVHIITRLEQRLVTILAPGGMGKTRLALHVAEQLLDRFKDGIYLVSLQTLSEPSQIVPAILSSMYLSIDANQNTKTQLISFLGNKSILLILDNFDHFLDSSHIITEILHTATHVTIIVTSREKLNLSGESVYTLHGMEFPRVMSVEEATKYDSVQFLQQTARRIKSDWTITDDNLNSVLRICQLTQGMPLAILLAMSWLDMLSVEDIADEIAKNVDFLETQLRDIPERQQSIRAVFATTWQHLTSEQQSVLMKISVFCGGFTRSAADNVAGASLRTLHALTSKALLQLDQMGRYHIHELLRQYAEARLEKSPAYDAVREAHMRYYARNLTDQLDALQSTDRLEAIENIDLDIENVRLAWIYAHEHNQWLILHDMVTPLALFSHTGLHLATIRRLFGMTVTTLQQTHELTIEQEKLFMRLAVHYQSGMTHRTEHEKEFRVRHASELAYKHENDMIKVQVNQTLATLALHKDNLPRAKELIDEAISLATELGEQQLLANVLITRSNYEYQNGDIGACLATREHVFSIAQDIGDMDLMASARLNAGLALMVSHEWQRAYQYFQDALEIVISTRTLPSIVQLTGLLCTIDLLFLGVKSADEYLDLNRRAAREINHPDYYNQSKAYLARFQFAIGHTGDVFAYSEKAYERHRRLGKTDLFYDTAHWIMIAESLHSNFRLACELMPQMFAFTQKYRWIAMILLDCMVFLPMLQDKGDHIRTVELIAMFNEHPKTLSILSRHPYVLELQEQLQAQLDETTYQDAWERGAVFDPMVVAPRLVDEFSRMYAN